MKTLGLRHAALYVRDPQASKKFYVDVLGMQLEWEPDPENVYLTYGGHDNLALHRASAPLPDESAPARLDHLGFAVPSNEDVDAWHAHLAARSVRILREIKTHRDGARSFYFADPDGVVIQIICHPPISRLSDAGSAPFSPRL